MRRIITLAASVIAVALLAASPASASDQYPECDKPARTCAKIKRVHRQCNTWACVKRVKAARAKRERRAARRMRTGLTYVQASWYGPGLYGNPVGCQGYGTLQPGTFGVAHKTLPCGTRVVLCAAACVVAPVIDRGPYAGARVFDLTGPVKNAIGMGDLGPVGYKLAR